MIEKESTKKNEEKIEEIMIDLIKADIVVTDDTTGLPGKSPWLLVSIDPASRRVSKIQMSTQTPTYQDVLNCLVPKKDRR